MTESTANSEKATLLDYLEGQRSHITGILEGLDEDAMHRAVLPSGWTPAALVNHLALDVERFWFRAVVSGDRPVIDAIPDEEDAWKISPDVTGADVVDRYRQEIERANAIIVATPIEASPAWWPDFFPNFRFNTLREVMLHVITESACHAGHLDAARELIDGRQWIVLTE